MGETPRACSGPTTTCHLLHASLIPLRVTPMSTRPRLFEREKPVIAVIHVGPTPGAPGAIDVRCAVDRAAAEARVLVELGVDGLLVENAHDRPGIHESEMGPEVAAFLTRVTVAVKRQAGRLPVGVRVVEGANRTALAVAQAAGCDFVQAQHLVSEATASGQLRRYRTSIGADQVHVLADIRPASPDEAEAFIHTTSEAGVDGVVLLGRHFGQTPDLDVVSAALAVSPGPLYVGGGLCAESLPQFIHQADGFVVGSALKESRRWRAPICERSVRALIGELEYARGQEVRQ